MVWARCRRCKVVRNDVPTRRNTIRRVRVCGGSEVHGGGRHTVSNYVDRPHDRNAVVVDNVVWTWLVMTVKYQTVAQESLGLTAR